ncbi:hypothetical protein [Xanthobacter autotrophicus]|uniref:hypothetical protein n=1 Tax=Xanthobacter autotrophicus TaxID=280 RepID=UPI0024A73CB6|nr:hypothetical protein [Xanthobacter autotrophicus]MDI4654975.1 hypothetical protein [Xanthobacter autotrophicus]
MTVQMILLPLFVHVALVLAVLLRAIKSTEVTADGLRAGLAAVLFYTLTTLALYTRKADVAFVVLAWVFVLLRIISAFPHLLSAAARGRMNFGVSFDLASLAVLALMWGLFAFAILLSI